MNQLTAIEILLQSKSAGTSFTSLLQRGVILPVEGKSTIKEILLSLPGFSSEYIEKKIQTLFVNGTPADSLQQLIPGGSTLAISAAMPGLAGAIFKKQSIHGSLRSQATPVETIKEKPYITIKVFNLIAADKGEGLLNTGCLFTGQVLHNYFFSQSNRWPANTTIASHRGTLLTIEALLKLCRENTFVQLRLEAPDKAEKEQDAPSTRI